MSSHREAPEISKDPVADSTDVYAFIDPAKPGFLNIIVNYIPLQQPDGGPNFYEFADDVQYDIRIQNDGKGNADVIYRFRFSTKVRASSFLYNTGQITDINGKEWNRPQSYTVSLVRADGEHLLTRAPLMCPPVNVGVRSTPNYDKLAAQAIHKVGMRTFFAGQRADAFHVDLGSIFDLGGLRPLNQAHLIPLAKMDGINSVQSYNVHTIAVQVPISDVTSNKSVPKPGVDVKKSTSVIGIWTTASRQKSRIFDKAQGKYVGTGPWQAVSRLGNPLFNEVLVPMDEKDLWNSLPPGQDSRFAKYVNQPELAKLLPFLYPGAFPNLKAYTKDRADLDAILLTGIPDGIVPGFQNYTGPAKQDMLRINLAVAPTDKGSSGYSNLGVVGGDLGGYPNGRRIDDDVVTIELRAVAGATIPLVDPTYEPDPVVNSVTDGTTNTNEALLPAFPYLAHPGGGYQTMPGTTKSSSDGYGLPAGAARKKK